MTKEKPKVNWKWDEKTQKLTRDIRENADGMEQHVVTIFTKDRAIKLKQDLKNQVENMTMFKERAEECKELNERKEDLPMYHEFEDIQKALTWEQDKQMKPQYESLQNNFDLIKEQYDKLCAELPEFKNK